MASNNRRASSWVETTPPPGSALASPPSSVCVALSLFFLLDLGFFEDRILDDCTARDKCVLVPGPSGQAPGIARVHVLGGLGDVPVSALQIRLRGQSFQERECRPC